jgi:dienelactone hydrolase
MRIRLTYLIFNILTRYGVIPLFAVLTIVFLIALRYISTGPLFPDLATMLAVGFFLCSAASALAAAPAAWRSGIRLLPVLRTALLQQPSPTGPFGVADIKVTMTPVANMDRGPNEPILVHFYYPVEAGSEGSTADFSLTGDGQLDGVVRLRQSDQPHRLVLLAPGLYGTPSSMALVARNIASHGYLVAGIDDLARDTSLIGASADDEETRLRPFDFSSAEALEATMRRSSERVKRIASRALTVLDRIDVRVQNSAGLRDRIDLRRVGFVGFSFGGGSAAESSFMDSRIAAVANLDGSLFGRASESPVRVPYLLMHSDFCRKILYDPVSPRRYEYLLDQNDLRVLEVQASYPESHIFIVRGSFHETFMDPSLGLKNLVKWLLLDPYRAHQIISAYLIGFLNAYLRDDRSDLLGASNAGYPEVQDLFPAPSILENQHSTN